MSTDESFESELSENLQNEGASELTNEDSEEEPPVSEAKPPTKQKRTRKTAKPAEKVRTKRGESSSERSFKLVSGSIICEGDSPVVDDLKVSSLQKHGKNPMQAGKKIFTSICRATGVTDRGLSYIYSIEEITPGRTSKQFSYHGVKEKLTEPRTIKRGDSSYAAKYESKVRSHKQEKRVPVVVSEQPVVKKPSSKRGRKK